MSAPRSAAAPPPDPGTPAPSYYYEPPSSRPRRSRAPLYAGVVAVVIALIVVFAFVFPGLGPSAPSIPSGAITYGQAAPGSNYSVRSFAGTTNWSLLFAVGIDSPTAVTTSLALGELGLTNCTFAPAGGGATNLTVPAFAGNVTSGTAPFWEFAYRNVSGAIALALVANGRATTLGLLETPVCTAIFAIVAPIPARVLDSPDAGASVATGASGFLAAHPNASALYGLIGGVRSVFRSVGSEWFVQFSTCSLASTAAGTGAQYNATINATVGTVYYAHATASMACGGDPPGAIGPTGAAGPVAARAGPRTSAA